MRGALPPVFGHGLKKFVRPSACFVFRQFCAGSMGAFYQDDVLVEAYDALNTVQDDFDFYRARSPVALRAVRLSGSDTAILLSGLGRTGRRSAPASWSRFRTTVQ